MDSSNQPCPNPLASHPVRLAILWVLQAGLLTTDLFTTRDISLLGFFLVPALLAATFSSPRQVALLAAAALACGLIFGWQAGRISDPGFHVRLGALVIIGLLTVLLAVSRTRGVTALADERNFIRGTLDSLLDPHVLLRAVRDERGKITDFVYADANDAACRYNQLPREKLLGRRLLELLPAHVATGLLDLYRHTIESGRPLALDGYLYPHDILEEPRYYDIRAVKVGDALSFTWRDVTERYLFAQKLAASEEHYRLLSSNLYDTVLHMNDDGIVTWVAPSLDKSLGYHPEEWIGHPVTDFLVPEDKDQAHANIERCITRDEPVIARYTAYDKQGRLRHSESYATPNHKPDGTRDGLVVSFHLIDEQVAMEQELERRARTDELTSLLNRKEIFERIEAYGGKHPRTGQSIAVLFCDLDKFKTVNDTYGHAAGDEVLRVMADRIRHCLRGTDDLGARVGGDELLVVLHGVQDLANAVAIAEKLRLSAAEPISTPAGVVNTTVSIGVTLARPGEKTGALIDRADEAMYRAKQQGRNQVIPIEA